MIWQVEPMHSIPREENPIKAPRPWPRQALAGDNSAGCEATARLDLSRWQALREGYAALPYLIASDNIRILIIHLETLIK